MEIKYRTELGLLLNHHGLVGHAVEIGVAEGRNAEVLISQPAITLLYLIDSWTHLNQPGDGGYEQKWHENNFIEAQQRTSKFKEKAVFLKGMSHEMIKQIPDDSLVIAYIDGDHSYQGCYNDLKSIWPKLKSGGILAGHDYLNMGYGVNKAVNDFVDGRFDIHTTQEDGDTFMVSFWLIKK